MATKSQSSWPSLGRQQVKPQLVEERGSTEYFSAESSEQMPRIVDSSSSDGARWWERREAKDDELSFPLAGGCIQQLHSLEGSV